MSFQSKHINFLITAMFKKKIGHKGGFGGGFGGGHKIFSEHHGGFG